MRLPDLGSEIPALAGRDPRADACYPLPRLTDDDCQALRRLGFEPVIRLAYEPDEETGDPA